MTNQIIGSFVSGFTIVLLWVAVYSFQAFLVGSCDFKFGCKGGVQFVLFLSSIAGITSSIAFFIACILGGLRNSGIQNKYFIYSGFLGGLLISPVLLSVSDWGTEIAGMVMGWFILSLVLFSLILVIMKRLFNERT